MEEQYVFSTHEHAEVFPCDSFPTFNAAVEEAKSHGVERVRIGKLQQVYTHGDFAETILERISESVYEQAGEVAEDYLSDIPRNKVDILDDRLNEVVQKWMDDFGYHPSFQAVIDVVEYDLVNDCEVYPYVNEAENDIRR